VVVCVGSVLAQELDELSLFLLHPYLVNLYLVDWLWFLGFVPLLYEPCFYPCIDTQAWLAWWLCCCMALLLLPSTLELCALICWNLSPWCVLRFGLLLPLSCAVPGFGQAQVCGDSLHCPNWILCYLLTVQTEPCVNTYILASVGVLLLQVCEDGHGQKIYFKSYSLGFSLGIIL
jgi:hypothetical protein